MTDKRSPPASTSVPAPEDDSTDMPTLFQRDRASTPEELEAMFEDALLMRDRAMLPELFEETAVLVANDGASPRGGEQIAKAALAIWDADHIYVADPRQVVQARDVALILAAEDISVARRDRDGVWRYAIILRLGEDRIGRSAP